MLRAIGLWSALSWACQAPPETMTGLEPDPTEPPPIPVSVCDPSKGPTVTRNATIGSILEVCWNQPDVAETWVEFTFDGETRQSPVRSRPQGPASELLLGVPFAREVDFAVRSGNEDDALFSGRALTGSLPSDVGSAEVLTYDPDAVDPAHPYVFAGITPKGQEFYGDWWIIVFDRLGRVVWALESPDGFASMHPRISQGLDSFLLDRNGFWGNLADGADGYVEEVLIDGTVLQTTALPYLRHAYTDLPDGSFVWGAISDGLSENVERLYPDGTMVELWQCRDWVDDKDIGEGGCASNSVSYHEPSGHLLYSMFTNDTVVELDATSGELSRHFGRGKGAHAFVPENAQFFWQHNVHYTDSGTLLVSTETTEGAHETVVREYQVNEADEALEEIWNFGIGDGLWSNNMGEAHRLPNGNTVHNYGETARIREADPNGTVVWDLDWGDDRVIGRSTPIGDLYTFAGSTSE